MENERYIVLQYPMWELNLTEMHAIYESVQTMMKKMGYKVIMIPSCVQWMEMDREELLQVRGIIDWILERKENDTYSEARARIEDSDREI